MKRGDYMKAGCPRVLMNEHGFTKKTKASTWKQYRTLSPDFWQVKPQTSSSCWNSQVPRTRNETRMLEKSAWAREKTPMCLSSMLSLQLWMCFWKAAMYGFRIKLQLLNCFVNLQATWGFPASNPDTQLQAPAKLAQNFRSPTDADIYLRIYTLGKAKIMG